LTKITSGNIYRINSTSDAVIKNSEGTYLPSTVTFSAEKISAEGAQAYSGRFIIATSTDGLNFTTAYTSVSNESSTVYTVPSNIVSIRANLYLAGGTVTLLDSETIPIVSDGTDGDNAQYVIVSGEQAFKFLAGASVPTSSTIILSAALFGGLTTYDWEYWNGSSWVNLSGTQNTSTYSLAYNNAAFTGNSLRVRCLSGTQFDEITIVKLFDGATGENALSAFLTNESHTAPALSDGSSPNLTNSGGTFKVFSGTTDVTSASTLTIVGGSGTTTVTKVQNSLTMTLTESTGAYTLSGSSWSTDTESFTLRATYNGATIDKIYSISKAKAGINGTNGEQGPIGPTGAQARIAYAIGASNFAFSGTTTVSRPGDSLPASGDWGLTTTWSATPQTLTTSGTSLYQVTGLYDGTNTVWAGYPYLSALKVGELSAITATIGTLRTATSGARTEIKDNLIEVYDSSGNLRVRLGVWT
jgi:hypothetical protein